MTKTFVFLFLLFVSARIGGLVPVVGTAIFVLGSVALLAH